MFATVSPISPCLSTSTFFTLLTCFHDISPPPGPSANLVAPDYDACDDDYFGFTQNKLNYWIPDALQSAQVLGYIQNIKYLIFDKKSFISKKSFVSARPPAPTAEVGHRTKTILQPP